MKKNTVGMLLGMTLAAVLFTGCGNNEATEAVNESAEIEQAGEGESTDTEVKEESKEESTNEAEETDESAAFAVEESEAEEPSVKVGVLLPDSVEDPWASDGQLLRTALEADGYAAEVVYAQGDSEKQAEQIESMIEEEIPAMIIAPVDEYGLTDVLAQTKEKGIYVFSYDRLIRDTAGVNYYTTFSGRSAGQMIGKEIVREQELDKVRDAGESRTIEFLMGSLDDYQALFLYNGVMEILQPYLDDGTLVCPSGRISFDDTGILRWGRERAGRELQSVLDEFYQDMALPDIICTGYDDAACGAADVLEAQGLTSEEEEWPMITGCGCEKDAVKYITEGKISCSIFMNRSKLAEECVRMVDTYLKGEKPEVNDYKEYDNGKKIIGTYICDGQLINDGNYESLIDNGYYEEYEILPETDGESDEAGVETGEADAAVNGDEAGKADAAVNGSEAGEPDAAVNGSEAGETGESGKNDDTDSDSTEEIDARETEDLNKKVPEDSILSILEDTRKGL